VEQGRLAGLVSALGVHAGTLVHVAAAALGVSALLVSSAVAFEVVKYLGALYLVYLGVRKLLGWDRSVGGRALAPRSLRRLFAQGVVVNVLNPKTALFFLAFLPQFVDVSKGAVGGQILALGLIFVALGVVSDGLYAVAAGTAGAWLKRDGRLLRAERYVSGGVFVGLGLTAALAGNGRK
jgi:threonine/homoserine/homoserine lactone efflux protein